MTITELIITVLEKQGTALTIEELVKETNVPAQKLRQVLTTYSNKIVRIGNKTFDLAYRIYPGRVFRYTPSVDEIKKGLLMADDDFYLFLSACFDYQATITLIDQNNIKYDLKASTSKLSRRRYFRGFKKWYKKTDFKYGDDILVTCIDLNTHTYSIRIQKNHERDRLSIAISNHKLADMIFDILNHSISKYESDIFLVRKYIFVYPYEKDPPPDQLLNVLKYDRRFLISRIDKMVSWTGHRMNEWLTIGLRKYYYQNDRSEWVPVTVITDEFGRYGSCSMCGDRMRWSKSNGWRHLENEMESIDAYLNNSFLKEGLRIHN